MKKQFPCFNAHLMRGMVYFLAALFLTVVGLPAIAQSSNHSTHSTHPSTIVQLTSDPTTLEQQGRQLYQAEQFSEAIALWQQAEALFQRSGERLKQAMTLSNLSLAYQHLGQWDEAETAIQQAIALFDLDLLPANLRQSSDPGRREQLSVLAQVLDVQGRLQLARGQAETALATWRQAAEIYTQIDNPLSVLQNQMNQAQALQTLGFYRQARDLLTATTEALQDQPDSTLKAIALRSLGQVLRVLGDLEASQQVLQQSLTIAQALSEDQAISEALISLGNTTRMQGESSTALLLYQQAAAIAPSPMLQVTAQIRQLNLLLEEAQFEPAQVLLTQLLSQIEQLPLSRSAIFAQIEWVRNGMHWLIANQQGIEFPSESSDVSLDVSLPRMAQILVAAIQNARRLQDFRAESYALGTLAHLYEQQDQWADATTVNQQALQIAQDIHASDIAYQWQWQLGRLLRQQGDVEGAIAAYEMAVETLQSLRRDLVAIQPDIQYTFRDDVEPVYRQFVDLLLRSQDIGESEQVYLRKARETMEALQLAELDNFLREACLAPKRQLDRVVDEDAPKTAVIYSIILPDRIEVILKLPQQARLYRYATAIEQAQVEQTLDELRRNLIEPYTYTLQIAKSLAQTVYSWLIQPAESLLAQYEIDTLVFVSDGALRNVPMAALYDGQHYLVERYAIALSSGLQLVEPQPFEQRGVEVLAAGLSEARHNLQPLQYVEQELEEIQADVSSQILLNQQFTTQFLQSQINSKPFSIVHLATHGQFDSDPDQTYIAAWDQLINVNELDNFLRTRDLSQANALELLVLSACQTAEGDRYAVLGLAGIAVRAGARSTLASLWNLEDESTAELMNYFYQSLLQPGQTRSEALRQAQLALLHNPQYQHPRSWAPYVLIGSWL